jgi:hypothetical protein
VCPAPSQGLRCKARAKTSSRGGLQSNRFEPGHFFFQDIDVYYQNALFSFSFGSVTGGSVQLLNSCVWREKILGKMKHRENIIIRKKTHFQRWKWAISEREAVNGDYVHSGRGFH